MDIRIADNLARHLASRATPNSDMPHLGDGAMKVFKVEGGSRER